MARWPSTSELGRVLLLLSSGGLAALACGDPLELPPAPDLEPLVAAYEHPQGTVDPQRAAAAADRARNLRADPVTATLLAVTGEGLAALRDRLEASGWPTAVTAEERDDLGRLRGVVRMQRTCRGWDPTVTTPDPANGRLELVGRVEDGALQRTLGGTASACRARADLAPVGEPGGLGLVTVTLDGDLALRLDADLPEEGQQGQFLLQAAVTVTGSEGTSARLDTDFRVVPAGLQLRVPVSDGDLVVTIGPDVEVRGGNGRVVCPLDGSGCAGGSVESRRR